jgi:formylglycine-generating enzyme required for sulfatase activity
MNALLHLLMWVLLALPVQAQILAVLDKSRPEDADLTPAKLSILAQAVRGEAAKRLNSQGFTILSEENTVSILKDMGVNLASCQGECEVEIARKLQADWLLSTQLVRFGRSWTLQLNLFETASGALKASERVQVTSEDQLLSLAEEKSGLLCVRVAGATTTTTSGRFGQQAPSWDLDAPVGVLVTFTSDPVGASLRVDGAYLGETPLTREVQAGPHQLEWSLQRYETLTEAAQVERETTLRRSLTPLFGWLTITSAPADQPVWLDGQSVGRTPLTPLTAGFGPHVLIVGDSTKAYAQGERFSLAKGERKTLAFEIALRMGGLVLRCQDLEGNALKEPVKVDGQEVGVSPLQQKLPIGSHVLEAGEKRETVVIQDQQTSELLWQLIVATESTGVQLGQGVAGPLSGMRFVTLPAGTFQMGEPEAVQGNSGSGKQRMVSLSSFEMQTTEVTQAQWRIIMGTNPSKFKGDDRPVESVSWLDVQRFIKRLNQRDPGEGYRLPTEAEWEYACRAGSNGRWCFGDSQNSLPDFAWFDSNSEVATHPVGQKKPNAWGLHDLHGNVNEWCSDWFAGYSSFSTNNPHGAESGSYRVIRGGGWNSDAEALRCASRAYLVPSFSRRHLGFRLCRDAK